MQFQGHLPCPPAPEDAGELAIAVSNRKIVVARSVPDIVRDLPFHPYRWKGVIDRLPDTAGKIGHCQGGAGHPEPRRLQPGLLFLLLMTILAQTLFPSVGRHLRTFTLLATRHYSSGNSRSVSDY